MHTDIINAILAAGMIALIAGPLGCFVVWRKMAYFGDSLSHSAILGVALGIASGISMDIGIFIVCVLFGALLLWIQQKKILATDTILGLLTQSALAIGMVAMSSLKSDVHDIHDILFGDILTISSSDLLTILVGGIIVLSLLYMIWNSLVIATINEDLAQSEGINIFLIKLIFTLLIIIIVTLSFKISGVLLITSLLIIPAATARQISKNPKQMAIYASILGIISSSLGVTISENYQSIPSGPAIVVCSTILFVMTSIFSAVRK